jgi:hypothetical protein
MFAHLDFSAYARIWVHIRNVQSKMRVAQTLGWRNHSRQNDTKVMSLAKVNMFTRTVFQKDAIEIGMSFFGSLLVV